VQRFAGMGKRSAVSFNFDEFFCGTLLVWGVFRAKLFDSRQFRGVVLALGMLYIGSPPLIAYKDHFR
jgi:hypothetical protein